MIVSWSCKPAFLQGQNNCGTCACIYRSDGLSPLDEKGMFISQMKHEKCIGPFFKFLNIPQIKDGMCSQRHLLVKAENSAATDHPALIADSLLLAIFHSFGRKNLWKSASLVHSTEMQYLHWPQSRIALDCQASHLADHTWRWLEFWAGPFYCLFIFNDNPFI